MHPSRNFNWVPSVGNCNKSLLEKLEADMFEYYAKHPSYYSDIDFTSDNWRDHCVYRYIANAIHDQSSILEVGCGRANVLRHDRKLEVRYTGMDFSPKLIAANRNAFPLARFVALQDAASFPATDEQHDCVFSIFVLEHCVFPSRFLDECWRVLQPGGTLIILCPDMLGRSRMTSQRLGFSVGSGREKLRQGRWSDAVVTAWDTRVRMVFATWWRRRAARRFPRFYINRAPLCFSEVFQPDFDAVYLTFEAEIVAYLGDRFRWLALPRDSSNLCDAEGLIFLHGVKSPCFRPKTD